MTDPLKQPNKDRILAAFRREKADRVPNYEVLVDNPCLHDILGRDVPGRHTLANIPPQDYIEFVEKIGQDVIGTCFYGHPWFHHGPEGEPRRLDFRVKTRADFNRIFAIDISALDPLFRLMDDYAAAVEGTQIGLFVLMGSFFTDVYDSVVGFEDFMVMLYEDPMLVEDILEGTANHYAAVAERLVEYPLTFFYVGDDIAYKTSTIVNPRTMRKIWLPRMKRIFAPALSKGIPILFHSDGNIQAMMPDLIEAGISALNPIEPYGMDIREIKKQYGKDLTLVGNLDVGAALSQGTPDDVRAEARALIDDVGRDGGLVLASSHSITSNVPAENFLAMVETAQTYGKY